MSAPTPIEILREIADYQKERRTGSITINFNQGTITYLDTRRTKKLAPLTPTPAYTAEAV